MADGTCRVCGNRLKGRQTKVCGVPCKIKRDARLREAADPGFRRRNARHSGSRTAWQAKHSWRRGARRRLARAARGTAGGRWTAGKCQVCSAGFISRRPTRTCGEVCSAQLRERKKRERYQRLRNEVGRRAMWRCQICGDPVDPHLPPNALDSPTIDHVIPRSHGGSDDLENLQLAHMYCNSVKGDRIEVAA